MQRVAINCNELSTLKAKFHYASWFEAGRRQVRSWSPTIFDSNLSAISFEPASVMEFGFNQSHGVVYYALLK